MNLFAKPLLAALLFVGVECQSRRGVETRCRGRRDRDRDLEDFNDLRNVVFDLDGYEDWKNGGDLSFGFSPEELCTYELAINTCYYFLNNPTACNNPGYCFDLCGSCEELESGTCGNLDDCFTNPVRCGAICSDYLNTCLKEPCFGMGCGFTPNSGNLPDPEGGACRDIVDCFKDSESDACAVDICAKYGAGDDVCKYMTLMNIGPWDPYYIPCTCQLDLPEGDAGFSPAADPKWPGAFPRGAKGSSLTLNIRTDDFATETSWLVREFDIDNPGCDIDDETNPTEECWRFVSGGTMGWQAAESLLSYEIEIQQDYYYEFVFLDSFGDGFYSEAFGQGWYTITEGTPPSDISECRSPQEFERCGIVVSNFSLFESDLRVYVIYNSTLQHAVFLKDFNATLDMLGAGAREFCEEPGCYVPNENDGSGWPGFFTPQASDYVQFNMRTDQYPEESYINMYQLIDPQYDYYELVGWINPGDLYGSPLQLLHFNVEIPKRETIYKFEFGDDFGDGSCCEYGYGWYTINGAAGNTVLEVVGDEFTTSLTRYVWVDANGIPSLAELIPGRGYGSFTLVVTFAEEEKAAREPPNYDLKPPKNIRPNNTPLEFDGLSVYGK